MVFWNLLANISFCNEQKNFVFRKLIFVILVFIVSLQISRNINIIFSLQKFL